MNKKSILAIVIIIIVITGVILSLKGPQGYDSGRRQSRIYDTANYIPGHDGVSFVEYDDFGGAFDRELYFSDEGQENNRYECSLATVAADGSVSTWMVWLKYCPDKSDYDLSRDIICLADVSDVLQTAGVDKIDSVPGVIEYEPLCRQVKNPQLTAIGDSGFCWLSYEMLNDETGRWGLYLVSYMVGGSFGEPYLVSDSGSNSINHSIEFSDSAGGVVLAWQQENNGQYDIVSCIVAKDDGGDIVQSASEVVSGNSVTGDWSPDIAVLDDKICIAWDSYNGSDFDVRACWYDIMEKQWGDVFVIAGQDNFEGRVQVLGDSSNGQGRCWLVWEQGSKKWGSSYRFRGIDEQATKYHMPNYTDEYGPLHTYKTLEMAAFYPSGELVQLDMGNSSGGEILFDSIRVAAQENEDGKKKVGVFYEKPRLLKDDNGRIWLSYIHFFDRNKGITSPCPSCNMFENGWKIYATTLESKLADGQESFSFSRPVCSAEDNFLRDGMQSLAVTVCDDGIALGWTLGRLDRARESKMHSGYSHKSGIMMAVASDDGVAGSLAVSSDSRQSDVLIAADDIARSARDAFIFNDRDYELYQGDLHRHTDLSRCLATADGTLDDAYRYAIEVVRLDYLAVTDHGWDFNRGDFSCLSWWRSVKEVGRHRLEDVFYPFYGYERAARSHVTDFNIISLLPYVDLQYDSSQLHLSGISGHIQNDRPQKSIAIPHYRDFAPMYDWYETDPDDKLAACHPIYEIYQGCRDHDSSDVFRVTLSDNIKVGAIASSDHASTSCSYAGVWVPAGGGEDEILASWIARRTFGATDDVSVMLYCDDAVMGEVVSCKDTPEFRLRIKTAGSFEIDTIEFYLNAGKDSQPAAVIAASEAEFVDGYYIVSYKPKAGVVASNYIYAVVNGKSTVAGDGAMDIHRIWSSPIWFEVE